MLRMQRFMALPVAFLIALSFSACSSDQDNDIQANEDNTTQSVETNLMSDAPPNTGSTENESAPDSDNMNTNEDITLSKAACDDYSAALEVLDISHYPTEEEPFYNGRLVCVSLTDENGTKIYSPELNGGIGIKSKCANNSTFIFELEDKQGEKQYVIMQYVDYDSETGQYLAAFYVCDMDIYEETDQLRPYQIVSGPYYPGSISTTYYFSDKIEYKGGSTLTDMELGFDIEFDTINYKAQITNS